jgi:hypothetical protein
MSLVAVGTEREPVRFVQTGRIPTMSMVSSHVQTLPTHLCCLPLLSRIHATLVRCSYHVSGSGAFKAGRMGLLHLITKKKRGANATSTTQLKTSSAQNKEDIQLQQAYTPQSAQDDTFNAMQLSPTFRPSRSPGSSFVYSNHQSPNSSSVEGIPSSAGSDTIRDIKCDILANWLHTKQEEKCWTAGSLGEGVFVKKSKGNYACVPVEMMSDGSKLHQSITAMNIKVSWVAVKLSKARSLMIYSTP